MIIDADNSISVMTAPLALKNEVLYNKKYKQEDPSIGNNIKKRMVNAENKESINFTEISGSATFSKTSIAFQPNTCINLSKEKNIYIKKISKQMNIQTHKGTENVIFY